MDEWETIGEGLQLGPWKGGELRTSVLVDGKLVPAEIGPYGEKIIPPRLTDEQARAVGLVPMGDE